MELADFTAALADLEPVVTKDPKYSFHRAIGLLAHAHGRAGDPDKADALFRDATAISTLSRRTTTTRRSWLAGSGRRGQRVGRADPRQEADHAALLAPAGEALVSQGQGAPQAAPRSLEASQDVPGICQL